ncbi:hypothetical protein FNV43_RR12925 [Rhamnella rubrinervis]|uniref:Transcription factor CBF/NF-Y/archaeal histone domain-containing protein n=1 Tax=Rhamnella rubrinervis TaxID=2594499 RepID=A0A8K0MEK8_9ROSA|nr:hypothetical protein FNV43_RR12925 [Rhamnella rubrinervis]
MVDSDNESGGHNNGGELSTCEQDMLLSIANVSRIMKKTLLANAKISKDAKEIVQECVSEFIASITDEASDKCQIKKEADCDYVSGWLLGKGPGSPVGGVRPGSLVWGVIGGIRAFIHPEVCRRRRRAFKGGGLRLPESGVGGMTGEPNRGYYTHGCGGTAMESGGSGGAVSSGGGYNGVDGMYGGGMMIGHHQG